MYRIFFSEFQYSIEQPVVAYLLDFFELDFKMVRADQNRKDSMAETSGAKARVYRKFELTFLDKVDVCNLLRKNKGVLFWTI